MSNKKGIVICALAISLSLGLITGSCTSRKRPATNVQSAPAQAEIAADTSAHLAPAATEPAAAETAAESEASAQPAPAETEKTAEKTAPSEEKEEVARKDVKTNAVAAVKEERIIREIGMTEPIEKELAGGKADSYRFALASGQFLQAVVEQKGIDVTLTLFRPDGKPVAKADSPTDDQGSETISIVAEESGDYILEVHSTDEKAPAGVYTLKIAELRAATRQDKDRIAAESAFADAEKLVAQATEESMKKAIEKYEEALRLFRSLRDRQRESDALFSIGFVYVQLDDAQKALGHLGQALSIRRSIRDRLGEAETLTGIGKAYTLLSQPRKALFNFNQALSIFRAEGDQLGEADALNNIGDVYNSLGQKQKALDYFGQALSLLQAAGDRAGEANTLSNIGAIFDELGESQKALDCYNQALPLIREAKDRETEAVILNNVGAVYELLGEKQKALDYYSQSLPIRKEVGDRTGEAATLNNIGNVYKDLGDGQRALDYYKQALQLRQETGDRSGEAVTLTSTGVVYVTLNEAQKALDCFNQALPILRETEDRYREAFTLASLGLAYDKLGDFQKAIDYFNQGLTIRRAVGDRLGQSKTLAGIGKTYTSMGEPLKALDSFNQSLLLSKAVRYPAGQANALYGVARVERDRGNLLEAKAKIEAAIEIIESLRAKIISQDLRASYLASVQDYYDFLADLLMKLHKLQPSAGFDGAAFQVSERARARSLLELLSEAQADIRQGVDSELLERELALQQQINAKAATQLKLLAGKHTRQQAIKQSKDLSELESQLQDVQAQIRAKSPRYAALTRPVPLSLEEIRKQVLDGDTMLLEYALGEERSYLWAVTATTLSSFELPKRADIEKAALRVRDLLVEGNRPAEGETTEQRTLRLLNKSAVLYPESAAALSKMILGPVADQLGTKRLLIVAEGALQFIPFEALPLPTAPVAAGNETRFLVLEHEIAYLPSASTLAVLRQETAGRKPADKTVFVLADPVFENNDERLQLAAKQTEKTASVELEQSGARKLTKLDMTASMESVGMKIKRLPYTRDEAEGIRRLVPESELRGALDFEANRTALTSAELSQYRIIHIATHGFLNFLNPGLSGLVLSLVDKQGAPQDGFLLAHEVFNLNLPVELVVLSACETGLGKQIKGEGIVGLTRGFMYAGAPRVVVSLWSVDDKATSELMIRFYKGMLKERRMPAAAALRAAQIEMLKETQWKAPFYWAPFQLHGEWK